MHFPTRVQVHAATETPDGQGGHTRSFAIKSGEDAFENVRIKIARTGERERAGQVEGLVTHVAYARSKTRVVRGDRLTGSALSDPLSVLNVEKPSKDHHAILYCEVERSG